VAQVELDYQVFGCSDAIPVTDMVTNFVNEMQRLALLPYEF
jgi:NifU-like protein involved in Fe-S cluster formation